MHDFNNYKHFDQASGSELVQEERLQVDLMRNIPSQIEKFFEIQHFDFDNSNTFLNSPVETSMESSSETSSVQNYGGSHIIEVVEDVKVSPTNG